MMQRNVYDILQERGFIKQVTNEAAVRELFAKGQVTAYVGFDPTADSLHVGNLIGLMALAHLQREGHRPIAIIGDGTGMIGDPSGKTEMRKMLTKETILANANKIKTQIGRYIKLDGKTGLAVHNADWLLDLNYIDFLRDIGRHFSVNRMLAAEAYRARLETGLSFIEFNYQVLQAFDFLMLFRKHRCMIQLGGDDQWGNILAGVDLIRRVEAVETQGITWPLLTTAGGQKMGKTASGAVWLDAEKVSPYEFYQYWVNLDDRDVKSCLAYFTFLSISEMDELTKPGSDIRKAKEMLAFEATKITHGEEAARNARASAKSLFEGSGDDIDSIPSSSIRLERLRSGISVVDLLTEVGLTSSKSEARRLIEQGGAYINQKRINEVETIIRESDLIDNVLLLRTGKKRYHRVYIQD